MAQTTINVRIDENLKKEFEKFCNKTGLNVSIAINIFVKAVVKQQKIPFEITTKDPFYSPEHIAELERRYNDMKAERNVHEHEIIEVDEE